jgi:hypothetical protein
MISCLLTDVPQTVSLSDRVNDYDKICFDITFKYEHPFPGSSYDRRPITFYRPTLFAHETWAMLHHSPNGLRMIAQDGFIKFPHGQTMDGPRLLPLKAFTSDFISLSPGETWSDRIPLDDDELAEFFKVGERYRYQFVGAVVQWWDWGALKVFISQVYFAITVRGIAMTVCTEVCFRRITRTR